MPKPTQGGPNPLFTRWLQEWRDQAAERGRLRSQRAYERALSSLHKYPLPLRSGREARILQYFGEHICRQLDERLERHCQAQDGTVLTGLHATASSQKDQEDGELLGSRDPPAALQPALCATEPDQNKGQCLKKKQAVSRQRGRRYFPDPRSGAFAILVALYQDSVNPHSRGFLTKPELQRAAQLLCEKSFFLADPGSKNTAWSAISTLLRKELVLKTNIPARYSLTDSGLTIARELAALNEPKEKDSDSLAAKAADSGDPLLLLEGDDESKQSPNRDALPNGPTSRKQDLVSELQRHNVPFSIRKLHIGDFLWVARERVLPVAGQPPAARELVLDYVVERKRMPDLCSSIIDGRFREQKFRLRQCGISHPIYLVEDSGSTQHLSLPEKTLQQAMTNTQVVDDFFVKRTRDLRESAAYLTLMTRQLTRLYEDKTLLSCTKEELEQERPLQPSAGSCRLLTFAEFNEGAVKNKAQTVSEVFARQLMQISGISGDKAAAILERYKTPASLLAAYATCPTPQCQEQLLSDVKCGKLQRNLGPALSKTLAQLYCTSGPLP
ncbi:crossover junction endonuclease MUS81 isoform X2 [Zootoca vivipara]|uniref:crossover junction endonuclease MUS81 isoform X2 n=1 Tax=Zootoca vivipara TaxID=8524 RepID=UPI0015915AC8|nr:crossover junction endonuclease MUS81 isoform X2 [Zootoca vivipara]